MAVVIFFLLGLLGVIILFTCIYNSSSPTRSRSSPDSSYYCYLYSDGDHSSSGSGSCDGGGCDGGC